METIRLPEDFIKKMQGFLGEEWGEFARSYEKERYQALRFNPLKKGLLREGFLQEGVLQEGCRQEEMLQERYGEILEWLGIRERKAVPWEENAFYYEEEARPGKHPYHEAGLYYIQEPSAMSAAALLAPKPGMRVLDLCAAPGGKTTQLAAFLGQKGLLVANEIHPARAKILSQNVERMGIRNAIVTNEDSGKMAEHFPGYFHAILVDAPCSGEGMFRKDPEAMGEWSADQVLVCAKRQQEILENAAGMLLPGGRMVYSTCTFSPEENEQVIAGFLSGHDEFYLEPAEAPWFSPGRPEKAGMFRLWPHKLHGEGHFVAVLRKKGNLPDWSAEAEEQGNREAGSGKAANREGGKLDKARLAVVREFVEQNLSRETGRWILEGKLVLFKDQLYRLPLSAPLLDKLRCLRPGLHIGEYRKDRLEPAHALALALGDTEAVRSVNLSVEDGSAEAYLRGEAISLPGQEKKGWCLVCVDGFSLGWGKLVNGVLKNHYPKGLRRP